MYIAIWYVKRKLLIRATLSSLVIPFLSTASNWIMFIITQTGKKLVFRSEPPAIKKKDDSGADKASREEEELAYFFT